MPKSNRPTLTIRYFGKPEIPSTSGWASIVAHLESNGIDVHVSEPLETPTHLLVIDYVARDKKYWPNLPRDRRFLTATEPVTVNPLQFTGRISRKFNRVIVPSDLTPKKSNSVAYEGGYINPRRYKESHRNDGLRTGVGMINENKFSFVRGSNYILRTRLILALLSRATQLTIAGENWTRGLAWTVLKIFHHVIIASFAGKLWVRLSDLIVAVRFALMREQVRRISLGRVDSDLRFLSNFKVAVVIENESTYISEKLLAAFMAGCQCVYVGPPIERHDFPSNFLFQASPNVDQIIQSVEQALVSPYEISHADLEKFLATSDFVREYGVERRNSWIARSISRWIADDDKR